MEEGLTLTSLVCWITDEFQPARHPDKRLFGLGACSRQDILYRYD
jgi:hypothetical protein